MTEAPNQTGRAVVRMGDIFEGGMDLTILPCSAKKTISSAARRWVDLFGLTTPSELRKELGLGTVSPLRKFPGRKAITKHYAWAASVFNDATSLDAIENIGREIGLLSRNRAALRNIETPLLGTGAGRLNNQDALRAVAEGFICTSAPEATLCVFVFDYERFSMLNKSLSEGAWGAMWEAVQLKPGMFGIGVDLKKLLGRQ